MSTSGPAVLVAAKAAPVSHEQAEGGIVARLSVSTGSVAGDIASMLGATVVASAATPEDVAVASRHPHGLLVQSAGGQDIRLQLVRHAAETLSAERYGRVTEILWESMHGLWDRWTGPILDDRSRRAWESFNVLNDDFARALIEKSPEPGSAFLIHDYQLSLVPARLRAADPAARILYFHHIAWPDPDNLAILPKKFINDLLTGMLGADAVAFFARQWRRNFFRCVEDFLPSATVDHSRSAIRLGDHVTQVAVEPLSYSPDALTGLAPNWPEDLEAWSHGHPLIVHAARTDPIKNASRALIAFGCLADQEQSKGARMLVRLNPHRLHLPSHAGYLDSVAQLAARTNARFGEERVRLLIGNDRAITLGSLARADVVIINSVVDGQNLTAFEAVLVGERDPVLILSASCGCSEILGQDALIVNPYDVTEQAAAMAAALTRSASLRAAAINRMRSRSAHFTLPEWTGRQLRLLGLGDVTPTPVR